MTYQQCIEYLYSQLPMFQRLGAVAIKTDLHNIQFLSEQLNRPETRFPSVHIAGTNGKGSCSHLLAAVLQSAGYKTGLYTSPHIKDFRERIRINGIAIAEEKVVEFVSTSQHILDDLKPSFFELTVAMAFDYFAKNQVDIAVIEVGLGGRLDSTNIIKPLVSLITNIGLDHSDLLGNSLELIAKEKAGIIKPAVPVIIGERHPETDQVFMHWADEQQSGIFFAQDKFSIDIISDEEKLIMDIYEDGLVTLQKVALQLNGPYQAKNIPGVMGTLKQLTKLGYKTSKQHIIEGFGHVADLTGIKGRWQILGSNPKVICDTGHNRAAFEYIVRELEAINTDQLHMVLGFVNDKDIHGMLELLPKEAKYYFCSAGMPRSLDATKLAELAAEYEIKGKVIVDPNHALHTARSTAHPKDVIFVGGSTFVVAMLNDLTS